MHGVEGATEHPETQGRQGHALRVDWLDGFGFDVVGRVEALTFDAWPRRDAMSRLRSSARSALTCATPRATSPRAAPACLRRSRPTPRRSATPRAAHVFAQALEPRRLVERVDPVGGDQQRLVVRAARRSHLGRETARARADDFEVLDRVAAAPRRDVDQVDQHLGPLDVAENWCPRPCPSCAPSISPGTSATTNVRSPLRPTTPRFGTSVVNG